MEPELQVVELESLTLFDREQEGSAGSGGGGCCCCCCCGGGEVQ
jgi:hypothetical protein